ncbi:hypothetical protein GCK32_022268, partial [Trichostrongylus colubriformis]
PAISSDRKSLLPSHGYHGNTKLFKKSVLVNLPYKATSEASRKAKAKAFLKLPTKSSHKIGKIRRDHCEGSTERSRKRRFGDDDDDDDRENDLEIKLVRKAVREKTRRSTSTMKKEPLEDGEIEEGSRASHFITQCPLH